MKVPKDRFWPQNTLISVVLFVIVMAGYITINIPQGQEFSDIATTLALFAFILAVLQVVYCTYYLLFVEDKHRLKKAIYLLIIVALTFIGGYRTMFSF